MRFAPSVVTLGALVACTALGTQGASVSKGQLAARQADPLLQVQTSSGTFSGSVSSTSVYSFKGIPYAEDTSGAARFTAPVAKAPLSGTNDATQFGPSCPQYASGTGMIALGLGGQDITVLQQSEDCLRLNVWVGKQVRQAAANGQATAPVMIYVHGGSFTAGSSTLPIYNMETFVKTNPDVVVVTINYRLNLFGFPSAPQLMNMQGSQNFGLVDISLAIDWVRQNAKAFGADGSKITLMGQSSGGSAVDAFGYSHSGVEGFPSISGTGVRSLIVHSGQANGLDIVLTQTALTSPPNVSSVWNQVANSVGCGTAGDAAQLACMRSKAFTDISQALSRIQPMNVGPLADSKTWFGDFQKRLNRGAVARVPVLLGTNSNEGTLFVNNNTNPQTVDPVLSGLVTNLIFRCPAANSAATRALYGIPIYRYQYEGNWANVNCGHPALGAYHGSELWPVFGNVGPQVVCKPAFTNGPSTVPVPPEETATANLMMQAWGSFVRNPTASPAAGWGTQVTTFNPTLAAISRNNSGTIQFVAPITLALGCTLSTVASGTLRFLEQVANAA